MSCIPILKNPFIASTTALPADRSYSSAIEMSSTVARRCSSICPATSGSRLGRRSVPMSSQSWQIKKTLHVLCAPSSIPNRHQNNSAIKSTHQPVSTSTLRRLQYPTSSSKMASSDASQHNNADFKLDALFNVKDKVALITGQSPCLVVLRRH